MRSRTRSTRETFGQPIGNYQAIQWMLADMATELDAARMLTWKAADCTRSSATRRCEAGPAQPRSTPRWRSCWRRKPRTAPPTRRMQILASAGYRRGSVVERLFRDVRATEIYQGTSEVQRMVIAEHILS